MNQITFKEINEEPMAKLRVIQNEGILAVYLNGNQLYILESNDKINRRYSAVQLYLTHGINQREIAQVWGVTIRSVNAWIAAYRKLGLEGLKDKKQGRPQLLNHRMRVRIMFLRQNRHTISEIARIVKVSPRSVTMVVSQSKLEQTQFSAMQESVAEVEEPAELKQSSKQVDALNRSTERMAAYAANTSRC